MFWDIFFQNLSSIRKYSIAYCKKTHLAKTSNTNIYAKLLIAYCVTKTVTTCTATLTMTVATPILIRIFRFLIFIFILVIYFYIFLIHFFIRLKIFRVYIVVNIYWSIRILNFIVLLYDWIRWIIHIIHELYEFVRI